MLRLFLFFEFLKIDFVFLEQSEVQSKIEWKSQSSYISSAPTAASCTRVAHLLQSVNFHYPMIMLKLFLVKCLSWSARAATAKYHKLNGL